MNIKDFSGLDLVHMHKQVSTILDHGELTGLQKAFSDVVGIKTARRDDPNPRDGSEFGFGYDQGYDRAIADVMEKLSKRIGI